MNFSAVPRSDSSNFLVSSRHTQHFALRRELGEGFQQIDGAIGRFVKDQRFFALQRAFDAFAQFSGLARGETEKRKPLRVESGD